MTLKPEETLLIDKVEEAKTKAKRTLGRDCSAESHTAVVELVTFQADLTKLIFEKMAGIYEQIASINALIAGHQQLTWGDAAKQMAVRAPYALAIIVVALVLWFWTSGVTPENIVIR